jgi:hypothetical protein
MPSNDVKVFSMKNCSYCKMYIVQCSENVKCARITVCVCVGWQVGVTKLNVIIPLDPGESFLRNVAQNRCPLFRTSFNHDRFLNEFIKKLFTSYYKPSKILFTLIQ